MTAIGGRECSSGGPLAAAVNRNSKNTPMSEISTAKYEECGVRRGMFRGVLDGWYPGARCGACRVFSTLLLLVAGCAGLWGKESRKAADLGVAASNARYSGSAAVRDSVGAYTYYDGAAPLRVTGFGLVVGLGRNGSRDCPKDIYSQVLQSLYKRQRSAVSVVGDSQISPEEMIGSLDSAVVVVRGDIPPAASAGTRFEVAVAALPGTQTKSLRGGYLLPTDLSRVQTTPSNRAVAGSVLAQASGSILLNPFVEADQVSRRSDLLGTVVGGGATLESRKVRLVLTSPSYPNARRLRDRINNQFSGTRPVADATSPSFIELSCPPAYQGDEAHFLGLVRGLFLPRTPQFEGVRAHELATELVDPTAPHARIAWALEGLGVAALPVLRDLYSHSEAHVVFYSAAAGIRLDDHLAGDVMAMIAGDPNSEFRFRAIRALGEAAGMANAAHALRRLLCDADPRVRVAAYEALVKRRDPSIESIRLGRDNFTLDIVSMPGDKLVYAKRSGWRRIALFGEGVRCMSPVFYRAPDGSLTITAQAGDNGLTLLRTVTATGTVSPPIHADPDLSSLVLLMGRPPGVDLDGRVTGLGLDYGSVVQALHRLCEQNAVNANFMMEQPNMAELFGPSGEAGRPESEQ